MWRVWKEGETLKGLVGKFRERETTGKPYFRRRRILKWILKKQDKRPRAGV
jgi:hypothetical protein